MRSRTRLTVWVVITAALLSIIIGSFAILNARASEYRSLDQKLVMVLNDVAQSRAEPLSAALYSIQSHGYDFALAVKPQGAPPIKILTTSDGYDLSSMYRSKSLMLENGDEIIVAGSLRDINANLKSNAIQLGAFMLLLNVLFIFLGIYYVRSLARREDQLALERMQKFLGDASHELRTPLTVIKGYSEMLAAGQFTDAELKDRAHTRVNTEITRIENIISDLLLLAEMGETKDPVFTGLELDEIIAGHIKDFATLHPSRLIESQLDEVHIQGDRDHIDRLLHNIFSNITRHTPVGTKVRIVLTRQERASLLIEDAGPGLPSYDREIEHFHRFDRARSRDKGGSGLGMSIIAAIVSEHGGTVEFRKSSLGGLAIEILLP